MREQAINIIAKRRIVPVITAQKAGEIASIADAIGNLQIYRNGNEIVVKVNNINCDSIIKVLLHLLNKNNGESDNKMKNKILSMFGGPFAFKMLSLIPQESKDNMVMHFVNDQRDFIINMICEKISKAGIEAEIKDIEISMD